jgi:type I restriction enzyme R subunit
LIWWWWTSATDNFTDPAFDGEPVQIYVSGPEDSAVPPDEGETGEPAPTEHVDLSGDGFDDSGVKESRTTYVVDNVPVHVVAERVQYLDPQGRLITESLKDYTRKTVHKEYASLDRFLQTWTDVGQKKLIIEELEKHGVFFEALAEEIGRDYDAFDLICHVAFDQPPLTRRERAEQVRRRNYFTRYEEQARLVLDALLDKYADGGIENLEDQAVLKVPPLNTVGTPLEIVRLFGGKAGYDAAIRELVMALYT